LRKAGCRSCGVCGWSGLLCGRFAKLLRASDFCGEVANRASNRAATQSSTHGASDPGEVRPKQRVRERGTNRDGQVGHKKSRKIMFRGRAGRRVKIRRLSKLRADRGTFINLISLSPTEASRSQSSRNLSSQEPMKLYNALPCMPFQLKRIQTPELWSEHSHMISVQAVSVKVSLFRIRLPR
jgi:hypothetical protein